VLIDLGASTVVVEKRGYKARSHMLLGARSGADFRTTFGMPGEMADVSALRALLSMGIEHVHEPIDDELA
jgi:hypothetical protein